MAKKIHPRNFRRFGKTTEMLFNAWKAALAGEKILLVAYSREYAEELGLTLRRRVAKSGGDPALVKFCGKYEIPEPSGERLFIDSNVTEVTLASLPEETFRPRRFYRVWELFRLEKAAETQQATTQTSNVFQKPNQ